MISLRMIKSLACFIQKDAEFHTQSNFPVLANTRALHCTIHAGFCGTVRRQWPYTFVWTRASGPRAMVALVLPRVKITSRLAVDVTLIRYAYLGRRHRGGFLP